MIDHIPTFPRQFDSLIFFQKSHSLLLIFGTHRYINVSPKTAMHLNNAYSKESRQTVEYLFEEVLQTFLTTVIHLSQVEMHPKVRLVLLLMRTQ